MAQIFHPSTNVVSRFSIVVALGFGAAVIGTMMALARSPYQTYEDVVFAQPVPFSHDHHTAALGIDCRYCHATVERSAFAGIPATEVCMNCHKQIWQDSPMLEPVRASFRDGEALRWNRVHDLPDYAYFDHSIHVHRGVGCQSCHGDVKKMPLLRRGASLRMRWCLDCHRDPEKHVRLPEEVTLMDWEIEASAEREQRLGEHHRAILAGYQLEDGEDPELSRQRRTRRLESCSTCHH